MLSNSVYSQAELHEKYGGVVPEIASRNHLKKFSPLLDEALEQANIQIEEIDLLAATFGPGLVGPLLVGLSLGKSLAYGLEVPFIGVNHLEGHLFAQYITQNVEPPFIALLVSGGHTSLIYVKNWGDYRRMGRTLDDAAGESFDKVGYMTGLGYPAGPKIDRMSSEGDPSRYDFPRPMLDKGLDFSFSGLKTAVYQQVQQGYERLDLLASFQRAVSETLVTKATRAARKADCNTISVIGGVAANSELRRRLRETAQEEGIKAAFPPLNLCTDNAAMIGVCGKYRFDHFEEQDNLSLGPDPSLTIGSED